MLYFSKTYHAQFPTASSALFAVCPQLIYTAVKTDNNVWYCAKQTAYLPIELDNCRVLWPLFGPNQNVLNIYDMKRKMHVLIVAWFGKQDAIMSLCDNSGYVAGSIINTESNRSYNEPE